MKINNFKFDLSYHYTNGGYLRLPFNSCACNIGNNRIIIFGGSVHDVKTKETWVLSV